MKTRMNLISFCWASDCSQEETYERCKIEGFSSSKYLIRAAFEAWQYDFDTWCVASELKRR